jgi:ABC-type dipeptide transport system, periplasmic component
VEAAKAALQEGGYADSNGDGIVEKGGQPVKLKFFVTSGETSRSVAVFVQDCLRSVGIDTELEVLDDAAYGERVATGDFDICYTHPWLTTPQTYMSWRGATSEYDDFGIGFGVSDNFAGYLDTVLTSTDADEMQRTFEQVWREEYAFCPGTGLYIQPRAFIHKNNISGFIFNPSEEVIDLSRVIIE